MTLYKRAGHGSQTTIFRTVGSEDDRTIEDWIATVRRLHPRVIAPGPSRVIEGLRACSLLTKSVFMHRRTIVRMITGATITPLAGATTDRHEAAPTADSDRSDESSPIATANRSDGSDDGADVVFELDPYEIEACGFTCRNVTTTITNAGSDDATNVRVSVTVSAADEVRWETDEAVDRLEAGAAITRTKRVDLEFSEALEIRDEGWLTVETIVESDQQTERFVRETEI